MIRHIWTVYCSEQVVDAKTNNVSLIQVVEQLNIGVKEESELAQPKPISFDSTLVTLWARRAWDTPTVGEIRTRFIGPDGSDLGEPHTHEIDLQESLRMRVFMAVKGIVIKDTGVYEWVTERRGDIDEEEWVEESRIPIDIRVEVEAEERPTA